jgi:PGF-pre-PGF domain-containing protein
VKSESVLPVADFSTSVTGGYAPLSVTFTDRSQNATSLSWDVNGDGIEDSNASSFVYEYASAGTYTAKLTAINANGTNEKTATIIVDRKSSGGSSGGSSSSGGGGGSPEPAKNVEVKELSQVFITHGNHVKFNFPKNVTAIVYLSFDPRKTAGKTTAIVEMLKSQSTLTPDAPQGEVYSYLNIWVGNGGYATEKNIENATVCFRVKKSWIEDKGINWASIFLNRYSDGKWNELSTTLLREDEKYLYFVSETPGFSPFAITAEKAVIETLPETESSEQNENIELDIEKNTEKAENTGVSQTENSSTSGSGMIYFIIGMLGVLLLGGFLYRKDKLK